MLLYTRLNSFTVLRVFFAFCFHQSVSNLRIHLLVYLGGMQSIISSALFTPLLYVNKFYFSNWTWKPCRRQYSNDFTFEPLEVPSLAHILSHCHQRYKREWGNLVWNKCPHVHHQVRNSHYNYVDNFVFSSSTDRRYKMLIATLARYLFRFLLYFEL